ncbi:hypothetical protein Salat_0199200 [Sesamum alatum]|uniref:Uncharacterized protein n=1 Tax=Sesamum alatum TaxID=300844 RepID=A0AAE2CXX8_9LAMI|nr:hypothetical protein Salat_0199200 [Sesamum alatum]
MKESLLIPHGAVVILHTHPRIRRRRGQRWRFCGRDKTPTWKALGSTLLLPIPNPWQECPRPHPRPRVRPQPRRRETPNRPPPAKPDEEGIWSNNRTSTNAGEEGTIVTDGERGEVRSSAGELPGIGDRVEIIRGTSASGKIARKSNIQKKKLRVDWVLDLNRV